MRRKLVRDRIPEIVGMYGHVSGQPVVFEQIEGVELQEELERKVQEEAAEFLLNPSAEELSDLLEAAEALKEFYPEVDKLRSNKALQKGRFDEGWLMLPAGRPPTETLVDGLFDPPGMTPEVRERLQRDAQAWSKHYKKSADDVKKFP